ncbi:MAG: UDP-N-acetylglucosamine 2-epimerase (non-hydrolyzing) [Candidatus Binatia bacterium]
MPRARTILAVVGARPNLVKIAPILRALEAQALAAVLVHTGQHYDAALSDDLFADLCLPPPAHRLGVGPGSHAAMTGEIMRRLEPVLVAERPDVVLVVGDVNSTLAAALTAAKLALPVAHVEAGLRSFDRAMPEEVNRVVTDALATLCFTTEASATAHLLREGHAAARVHFVGNVMVDSLRWALPRAARSRVRDRLGLAAEAPFAILTLHRPENVDRPDRLAVILAAVAELARALPVIFPAHPRVADRLAALGWRPTPGILFGAPLAYLDLVHLLARARLVLTDSGGLQDETTALGVPCLTLRERTERPVTVEAGTSVLVGADPTRILARARAALSTAPAERPPPPLWDGHAAERIAAVLATAPLD